MRTTQQLSITLPNEMVSMAQRKVDSGEYASISEVVRDGLRSLQRQDAAIERWLRNEVIPSYDRYLENPETGVPIDEVLPRIKARYAAAKGG